MLFCSRWKAVLVSGTLTVLALLSGPGHTGQMPPEALLRSADSLGWRYNWPKAGPLYAKAERLFEEAGDEINAFRARIGRIRSSWQTMSFLEVSQHLSSELQNPIVRENPELRLQLLEMKGSLEIEINTSSARRMWEEARDLAKELGYGARESRAKGELALIAFLEGDSAEAVQVMEQAVKSALVYGDTPSLIRYFALIGNGMIVHGRAEEALRYFDRALLLAWATPDVGTPIMTYAGKAKALLELNRTAEARIVLEEALRQARLEKRQANEAELRRELARLSIALQDRPSAIAHLERAAELASSGDLHRELALALFDLSTIYSQPGEIRKAEEAAAAGIEASKRLGDVYSLPNQFAVLANLKASHGHYEEADKLYEEATDVIEAMLVNASSPGLKSSLVGAMSRIFIPHFALVAQELKEWDRAFHILERARGRTGDFLPPRETEELEQGSIASPVQPSSVQRRITELQIRLLRAATAAERRQLLDQLFEEEQYFAPLHAARFRSNQIAFRKGLERKILQNALKSEEVVLEYVLNDPVSFSLAISRDQFQVFTLPSRQRVEAVVDRYLAEVRSRRSGVDEAKELHSMLLEPIPVWESKSHLIIIPDGRLHLLPFESLIGPDSEYLIRTHAVTYSPSATVFYLLRSEAGRRPPDLPLLALGDVPYGGTPSVARNGSSQSREDRTKKGNEDLRGVYDLEGAHFAPLPWTAEEVKSVAEIAGPKSVVLTGEAASEAAFKSASLGEFKVLHLAVHGISSTRFPDRAAVVLAVDPHREEDGLLQAREIGWLKLAAELVTLSACDTGVGRLQGQAGMANLVQAFLFAGARSVLATLWAADDVFTTALMKRFYRHLAEGKNLSAALRLAKLDMLEAFGDEATPFYWANFKMTGEGSGNISFSD